MPHDPEPPDAAERATTGEHHPTWESREPGRAPRADGAPDAHDPEAGARSPDEYTEPPGSHRRPSDGAALDVGG